jgi:glyoxylase-like metal-dependent hydrolase (beta-lactamase superfamily II)
MVNEKGCRAKCTITLIRDGKKNILIDTGNVGEDEEVKKALESEGLASSDIDFVVITHYHPDHVGNNGLFKNAVFVDGVETYKGSEYTFFEDEYQITENVKVIRTPGHYSSDDCSVIVKSEKGIIIITGDLFWSSQDDLPPFIHDEKQLKKSRSKILKMADFIIPGHGNMFKVHRK